jgi:hypothetical protein
MIDTSKVPIGVHESFVCACHDKEHQLIVEVDEDTNEIIVSTHLVNNIGFFKRLGYIFRYILGKPTRYGHWDNIIIKQEDIPRLEAIIEEVKKNQ